ncbi:MAG: bifunctional proline dehydrogenase/L-glutamate gamma-semialdehyde dehydrogenase PutA [Rhodobacteraceae bacterium]|nr:bifunctional proline dehydrogenase/L-glutamate gamma-semialdehyde dehydrogenase PutA [Paracoccaceae bacterium]
MDRLLKQAAFSQAECEDFARWGADLVRLIRDGANPSMMELFLGEYGLSSEEGVALMCLAEALLRVPDTETIDDLIEDKIVPSAWGSHLGRSHSPLINASTWALMLTGKVLEDTGNGLIGTLHGAVKRLGEPVIRAAVARAMGEMGRQFVVGEDIEKAMTRVGAMEAKGYTYSYDMLGEAACTEADAARYHLAYARAIAQIARAAKSDDIAQNPGISIKLSALHPRYEPLKRDQILDELVPRVAALVSLARSAGIGLNIDAEEAARLDLSLDIIDALLSDPALAGWDGFGVVVQAYSKRAGAVIDWLYQRAQDLDRRIMVRLVKGAYWDTEIKIAQTEGLPGFPVFTKKPATDASYLACARKLLGYNDRIYPQFATHNAHTVAAVLGMAAPDARYEFQRLHGMGEALHQQVLDAHGTACRIYAPVGKHRDLLAYLVRRLLENGANSSFVNQIVDEEVPAEVVAGDPLADLDKPAPKISLPADLFAPRVNSAGLDVSDPDALASVLGARDACCGPWGAPSPSAQVVTNPATGTTIGHVEFHSAAGVVAIAERLRIWDADPDHRAEVLNRAAELFERDRPALFALLAQEAGKTLLDCIGEMREAVDFLRYYAGGISGLSGRPLGTVLCISPWNFPLAIFSGQVAAALAAGNAVIAKPAEATSLIAARAVALLHEAGVPTDVLALVPGSGAVVGPALCAHPATAGVAFTGSTATGQAINRALAERSDAPVPLIAETGGINAMIVDSTALLEQAVQDIVASAFQSAGQRCSALRVLYVQSGIHDALLEMLIGAVDALKIGDPSDPSADIGPVIDAAAKTSINDYVAAMQADGKLIRHWPAPEAGHFVGPSLIRVSGIGQVTREVFGPVLHIARFEADQIDRVVDDINAAGYDLTFGVHTRIDGRVQHIVDRVDVGNIYVNRNQIGAIVGSQPFGGHGLSGTGPKAGGPRYLEAFTRGNDVGAVSGATPGAVTSSRLPGPTGEDNSYAMKPRHGVICAGPGAKDAAQQADIARALGCQNVLVKAQLTPGEVAQLKGVSALIYWGNVPQGFARACAALDGPIVRLVTARTLDRDLLVEQTICVDTTASGGNAELLAASS